jgi:hypothetical protein
MQGVRDYIKYLKRGYGRTAHLVSIDIRNGRMGRAEAAKLIREHDGKRPASLDVFLEYVGITEDEFMDIVAGHVVAPWEQPDLIQIQTADELWDQRLWERRPCGSGPGLTAPPPVVAENAEKAENALPMAPAHGTFSQATAEAMQEVHPHRNGRENGDAGDGVPPIAEPSDREA